MDERNINTNAGRRTPDVFTAHKGQPIAFELQLAHMPVTAIIERTNAYRQARIRALGGLDKQASVCLSLGSTRSISDIRNNIGRPNCTRSDALLAILFTLTYHI